jgi:cytochrome c biogenesis protein CcdA
LFTFVLLLLLAGVMVSTKRRGWQWLTVLIGLIYIFLGVSAMIVPDYAVAGPSGVD